MLKLKIHRADGKIGVYSQTDAGAAEVLLRRLVPEGLFAGGAIVVGVHNPFNILNADHICYLEVTTDLEADRRFPAGFENIQRLDGREAYESLLARQWTRWRTNFVANAENLLEALVELSLVNGEAIYLHATGHAPLDWRELTAPPRALVATFRPNGTLYINPRAIVRARIYHSAQQVDYPDGLWFAEAEDI